MRWVYKNSLEEPYGERARWVYKNSLAGHTLSD